MTDTEKYTPLSDRLQQDVWHDNFVPKYSALASAKPSLLVLIGVWLVFVPTILVVIGLAVNMVADAPDVPSAIAVSIAPALYLALAVAILALQTQRYRAVQGRLPEEEYVEEYGKYEEYDEGEDDVDQ